MTTSLDLDAVPAPYQMAETELLLTGVTFDEADLRSYLPGSVSPVPGCTGVVAAYLCGACYPFGPYTGLYISADVHGFDAPDGSTGRVMLACVYGPAPEPAALMSRHVGFRALVGQTHFERLARGLRAATAVEGGTVFTTEMQVSPTRTSAAGSINWVRQRSNGEVVVSNEPWVGELAEADLVAARLDPDVLEVPGLPRVRSYTSGARITRAAFAFMPSPA